MPKPNSPNYAAIALRDKQALALDRQTGCGFTEAWLRVLDGEGHDGKRSLPGNQDQFAAHRSLAEVGEDSISASAMPNRCKICNS
jgi:hypothetical protein